MLWWPGLLQSAAPNYLRFEQIGLDEGLPESPVHAIAQDKQGFVWIGTEGGLNRYDGYRVRAYRHEPADPQSLGDDRANALVAADDGGLWVGTGGGLDHYDPRSDRFTAHPLPDSVLPTRPMQFIDAILSDGRGGLWLATRGGLQHFDTRSGEYRLWRHSAEQPGSLANDRITALSQEAGGGLWIGSDVGVDYLPAGGDSFEHYRFDESADADPQANSVFALHLDRDGRLWVGSFTGLQTWTRKDGALQRRHYTAADGLPPGWVDSIYSDREGTVWVALQSEGLKRWDPERQRFVTYRHLPEDPNSLIDDNIAALFQDRRGILWAGSWYGGVSRTDLGRSSFDRITQSSREALSLSDPHVTAVSRDADGVLWLGTENGLNRLDLRSSSVKIFGSREDAGDEDFGQDAISSLLPGRDGHLWVGTLRGLFDFDPSSGRVRRHALISDLPAESAVIAMAPAGNGRLWLASAGLLLYEFDPARDQLLRFRHDPTDPGSLSGSTMETLLVDHTGTLWIGSRQGLSRFDSASGRFQHFPHDPADASGIGPGSVVTLYEDRQQRLWAGTTDGALNRVDRLADGRVQFVRYVVGDSYAANCVCAIKDDDEGRLWLATGTGLSRFDPEHGSFRHYRRGEGGILGGYIAGEKSSARSDDGILVFGSTRGLTLVDPRRLPDRSEPPDAVLTELRVRNQPVTVESMPKGLVLDAPITQARTLTLPYRSAGLSLEFAALDYARPKTHRYFYRLDGLDTDWIETDASRRFTTYTQLDPGRYRFRLVAQNDDGVRSAIETTLDLVVLRPYWMSWWFRSVLVLLALGLLYLAYRLRVRQLALRQLKLEREVRARTAEIRRQHQALQEAHRQLAELSSSDPLTGLGNRRHVEQQLTQIDPYAPPQLLLMLIDLDHFKSVNDRYGHPGGDQVLVEAAKRLRGIAKAGDIVARWGGEEFLFVARDTRPEDAAALAERLRCCIADQPFALDGGSPLSLSCSIGFVSYPFAQESPQPWSWGQVLALADRALYIAKHGGRNAWAGWLGPVRIGIGPLPDDWLQRPAAALAEDGASLISSLPQERLWAAAVGA